MPVILDLKKIDKGRTIAQAAVSGDDYQTAVLGLAEAKESCTLGQWVECRARPGSGPVPPEYRGDI